MTRTRGEFSVAAFVPHPVFAYAFDSETECGTHHLDLDYTVAS